MISNREPGLIGLAALFYWVLPFTSVFNVAPASIAAALTTGAAMATLALAVRLLVSSRVALVAALIAGTATTTWAVSGTSLWSHGPDQLYLVAAMLALATARRAWAGLAFAAAILTRPPPAARRSRSRRWWGAVWDAWTRRAPRPVLVVGSISGVGLALLLVYSHVYWHGGIDSQYAAVGSGRIAPFVDLSPHTLSAFAINILGTLVSPGRGVLVGAPFLVVVACGLRPAWRTAPSWVRSAAVGGLLYLAVRLKDINFGGGATFWSYRYPLEKSTLMGPLFVLSWREWVSRGARRRAAFTALVVFAIACKQLVRCASDGQHARAPGRCATI